jgi:hypothetical protein
MASIFKRYDYGLSLRQITAQLHVPIRTLRDWVCGNTNGGVCGNSTTFTHLEGDCLGGLPLMTVGGNVLPESGTFCIDGPGAVFNCKRQSVKKGRQIPKLRAYRGQPILKKEPF